MATKDVKIKIRTASNTWEQLYPETIVDQIVDASTAGKALFKIVTPAADSYLRVTTAGAVQAVAQTNLRTTIGAAAAVHDHKISDINIPETGTNNYTGDTLIQALDDKADLVNGVVPVGQLPDFVLGGLQFTDQLSGAVTLNAAFRTTHGINTEASTRGKYFIAIADTTLTFGSDTQILAPGDEGDNISPVTIEAGDWLVFTYFEANVYVYSIVNSTYGFATTDFAGIVTLSGFSGATRSELSNSTTNRHERIVDERVLRSAMKDIIYATSEPANAVVGDLLFQEEV